jgi:hypothetical protein
LKVEDFSTHERTLTAAIGTDNLFMGHLWDNVINCPAVQVDVSNMREVKKICADHRRSDIGINFR